MTRRFTRFLATACVYLFLGAVVLWIAVILVGLVLNGPARHTETAASPSQRPVGAREAPKSSYAASGGSGRVLHAFSGTGQEEALSPTGTDGGNPAVAVGSGLPDAPGLEAGMAKMAGGSDFPTVPSAASLDVGSFALATPLVGFGGLHPIAESWHRGVASGIASHMGYGFPDWYLALPIGPGFRVRIVGAGGSVDRVSTDAGPALHMQRPPYNRVADLSVHDFVAVCGVPVSLGLCQVSISVVGRVR